MIFPNVMRYREKYAEFLKAALVIDLKKDYYSYIGFLSPDETGNSVVRQIVPDFLCKTEEKI